MFRQAVDKHTVSTPISQARTFGGLAASSPHSREILKSSLENTINKAQIPAYSSGKNPRKRTSSQVDDIVKSPRTQLSKASSMNVLDQLHHDMYFDENDFDDEINLDDEDPIPLPVKYPHITVDTSRPDNEAPSQPVVYPVLRSNPVSPIKNTPSEISSSGPYEWSSSPAWHKQPRPNPRVSKGEDMSIKEAESVQTPVPQQKKRRHLPWTKEEEEMGTVLPTNHEQVEASITPNVRPWTKSASAIKQEQNALRQKNSKIKKLTANQVEDVVGEARPKSKKGKKKMASVFLSQEQKMVLDLVTEKKESVFFTGSAGTGKSVLMREIIKALRLKYAKEPDRVAVTASTGFAACHISGVTLHSFAGIGLGKEPAEDLIKKIKKNIKAKNRWLRAKVLIVDEISMVDGKLFDKLEKVARTLRNDGRPFGGIQLVVTGDFFQLPPVPDGNQEATFAFDAATWRTVMQHTIGLTHIFRQKDPAFANMLNEMRLGKLSQSSIAAFHKLYRPLNFDDSIDATELFPTRDEVERSNRSRMQQLEGRPFTYSAMDGGSILEVSQRDKLLNNCMAPQQITLKKGAQVMLIKNLDDGLVNGSIGKVIAFMDERTYDLYREDDSSLQPPDMPGLNETTILTSKNKIKDPTAKDTSSANDTKAWPLVSFQLQDGTTRQLLCVNEKWTIELPNGEVQASRAQVPLILAWALSIHKAQGQTLERVKVDLGKVFEKGQAYVALSRATTQDGLQILNFNPKKVMAHEKVRKFYESLSAASDAKPVSKSSSIPNIAPEWIGDSLDDDNQLLELARYP